MWLLLDPVLDGLDVLERITIVFPAKLRKPFYSSVKSNLLDPLRILVQFLPGDLGQLLLAEDAGRGLREGHFDEFFGFAFQLRNF